MGKYDLLWDYVKNNEKDSLKLTFKEIEGILGMPIDHSFLKYKVGKISMKEQTVIFDKFKDVKV